jgi:hypothetical protein
VGIRQLELVGSDGVALSLSAGGGHGRHIVGAGPRSGGASCTAPRHSAFRPDHSTKASDMRSLPHSMTIHRDTSILQKEALV